MLPKVLILAVCVVAVVARNGALFASRNPRAVGSGASSTSYSSSSSSSSSSSGGGGGGVGGVGGVGGEAFHFPTPIPQFGGFPAFGVTNAFQRFVETANAAHIAASQDPIFQKVYQQQMAILANLQQMAWARYPFAFPGFDVPNTVGGGVGSWSDGLGTRTGSDPAVFTSGAVSFGTPGGVGVLTTYPAGGLGTRLAEEFPAPSGTGTYGTFASSSSGMTNINGETTSYKTSTIGVNDNGRITFRTI